MFKSSPSSPPDLQQNESLPDSTEKAEDIVPESKETTENVEKKDGPSLGEEEEEIKMPEVET